MTLAGVFFPAKHAKYSKGGFRTKNLTLDTFFTTKERREPKGEGLGQTPDDGWQMTEDGGRPDPSKVPRAKCQVPGAKCQVTR